MFFNWMEEIEISEEYLSFLVVTGKLGIVLKAVLLCLLLM